MQSVARKFVSEDRLKQLISQVTEKKWITLNHGPNWTEDITDEQEKLLKSIGIKVYEDWPHGGNGHSVDGFIVELHFNKV
jgi:hypothetical protein